MGTISQEKKRLKPGKFGSVGSVRPSGPGGRFGQKRTKGA